MLAQYNPQRAERAARAGRVAPPAGVQTWDAPDLFCFLCTSNVRWQSRLQQLYYAFEINGRLVVTLVNPFQFALDHTTIASAVHEPQSWRGADTRLTEHRIDRIVADLNALARELPDWIVMYNGVGSGASIEHHLHFHALRVSPGQYPFPLQVAATRPAGNSPTAGA